MPKAVVDKKRVNCIQFVAIHDFTY